MTRIKNIIFDLGGVFIDINFGKTNQAFESFGISDFAVKFSQHHASPMFQLFETGKMTPEDFLDAFRKEFSTSISNEKIILAWNAMLGHFSKEKMNWLENINENYRTFLFSNTNKIHQDFFEPLFEKEIGRPIQDYFEYAYYSHDLGLRKPEPASFLKILQEQNLHPSETLFVDDTIGNILGAQAVGLATFHLDNNKKLTDISL